MRVLEVAGICVAVLLLLLFAVFFRRRLLMVGGGTIRLQVRVSTMVPGRGWSHGVGVFAGDELRFYRMFSLAFRPTRILDRGLLLVEERRRAEGPERLSLSSHWVILRCVSGASELEIAMVESTVTGFLSWLEAAPPGSPGRSSRPASQPRTI